MKLVIPTIALMLAAAPAFAQQTSTSDQTTIAPPQDNPNVDSSTAAADSAIANRDAAQMRADQDRAQQLDAQGR